MKAFLKDCIPYALLGTVLGPWVIGLVDLASWALVGSQMTSIPWQSDRGFVLILWPFVSFFISMLLSGG